MTSSSKLLTDESPLIILPQLAVRLRDRLKAYASDAAAFLQQIHYWAMKGCGVVDDQGRRWIYNTYEQWLEQFPWLTEYAFRKIKSALLGLGIIETKAIADHGRDRTLYYALNYNHSALQDFVVDTSTDGAVDMATPPKDDYTPNSTKTTSENASNIQAEWKKPITRKSSIQEIDPPSLEEMVELQQAVDAGEIHRIHLNSSGETKIIELDKLTQVSWRVFLLHRQLVEEL